MILKPILLLLTTTLLFSCSSNLDVSEEEKELKNDSIKSNLDTIHHKIILSDSVASILDSIVFQSPKDYTPISFLKEALIKGSEDVGMVSFFVITNDFPEDWVKESDIIPLMMLIESTQKCGCYLNPFASTIPNGSADLGGYAIILVNSFRHQQKIDLGLWQCPTTNKKDVKELRKWWKEYLLTKKLKN